MKIDINEALKRQASKEIDDQIEKFNMQIVTQIAVCLHRFEDYGNKRIKQFFEHLVLIQKETTEKNGSLKKTMYFGFVKDIFEKIRLIFPNY